MILLALLAFGQMAWAQTTYEWISSEQIDWSGNYVLAVPTTYENIAFNGTLTYAHYGNIAWENVTLNQNTLTSIGNAAVLTIAKSTYNPTHYSIRINGGDYLWVGDYGLETSSTEPTDHYWNIVYTSDGLKMYDPNYGDDQILYLIYTLITSDNTWVAFFMIDDGTSYYNIGSYEFTYFSPRLYKDTSTGSSDSSGITCEDFESCSAQSSAYYSGSGETPSEAHPAPWKSVI